MSEELKPCPFCGGTDFDVTQWIECNACGAFGPTPDDNGDYATGWNRRAQPAEAEWVEVVAYVGCQARMTTDGWENGEEYLVFADQATDADKRYDVPLMTVTQHLAALSAVTAERDQSISLTADYIAMLGEAGLQIDQLTAERDRLREAVELLSRLRGLINCTPENDVDKVPVWISTKHPTVERIDALLAAMAAKDRP